LSACTYGAFLEFIEYRHQKNVDDPSKGVFDELYDMLSDFKLKKEGTVACGKLLLAYRCYVSAMQKLGSRKWVAAQKAFLAFAKRRRDRLYQSTMRFLGDVYEQLRVSIRSLDGFFVATGCFGAYPVILRWIHANGFTGQQVETLRVVWEELYTASIDFLSHEADKLGIAPSDFRICGRVVREIYRDEGRLNDENLTPDSMWPDCMGEWRYSLPDGQQEALQKGEAAFGNLIVKLGMEVMARDATAFFMRQEEHSLKASDDKEAAGDTKKTTRKVAVASRLATDGRTPDQRNLAVFHAIITLLKSGKKLSQITRESVRSLTKAPLKRISDTPSWIHRRVIEKAYFWSEVMPSSPKVTIFADSPLSRKASSYERDYLESLAARLTRADEVFFDSRIPRIAGLRVVTTRAIISVLKSEGATNQDIAKMADKFNGEPVEVREAIVSYMKDALRDGGGHAKAAGCLYSLLVASSGGYRLFERKSDAVSMGIRMKGYLY
jgi:hypothetical protein